MSSAGPARTGYFGSLLKAVLWAGLVAGTLDILGSFLAWSVLFANIKPVSILHLIASGVWGKSAYSGGTETAVYGLLLHYFIALSFAAAYFIAYPRLSFLHKNPLSSGVVYGVFVWCVMNLIVLPIVFPPRAFTFKSVSVGLSLIILFVGLPVALLAHRYYTRRPVAA